MPFPVYRVAPDLEDVFLSGAACFPLHLHRQSFQQLRVLRGTAHLCIDGRTLVLHRGEMEIIPPLRVHSLRLEPGCLVRTRSIRGDSGTDLVLIRKGSEAMETPGISLRPGPEKRPGFPAPWERRKSGSARALEQLGRTMAAAPGEAYRLDRIAELSGLSKWHALRQFQACWQLPPHAFLLCCRVSLARQRLRLGDAAAEAALISGFADQSHLCRVFKRHHGITPGRFLLCQMTRP